MTNACSSRQRKTAGRPQSLLSSLCPEQEQRKAEALGTGHVFCFKQRCPEMAWQRNNWLVDGHGKLVPSEMVGLLAPEADGARSNRASPTSFHLMLPGDCVVLCTDKLHDNLTDREREEILQSGKPGALRLVSAAYERSQQRHLRAKKDNIGVIVAWYPSNEYPGVVTTKQYSTAHADRQ